eukprot:13596188-Alexandrium_andersonii.AAC.1
MAASMSMGRKSGLGSSVARVDPRMTGPLRFGREWIAPWCQWVHVLQDLVFSGSHGPMIQTPKVSKMASARSLGSSSSWQAASAACAPDPSK